MTLEELRKCRHPGEGPALLLALVVLVPLGLLLLAAAVFTAGILVLYILFLLWFGSRLAFAYYRGNLVQVNQHNFPDLLHIVEKRRADLNFKGEIQAFIYDESKIEAIFYPLFRRKVLMVPSILLEAEGGLAKADWIVSRFIGSHVTKKYRLMWAQVVLTSIESIAIFNILLYPYERMTQLSGDRIGLSVIGGDVASACDTIISFMSGEKLASKINVQGLVDQRRSLKGSFFAWLAKCLSPFPHNVTRITSLLAFAAREFPSEAERYVNSRKLPTSALSTFGEDDRVNAWPMALLAAALGLLVITPLGLGVVSLVRNALNQEVTSSVPSPWGTEQVPAFTEQPADAFVGPGPVPRGFDVSVAKQALAGQVGSVNRAFTWSSAQQGASFWQAEHERVNAGSGLSATAASTLSSWIADAEREAGALPKRFSLAEARSALQGTSGAVDRAFLWDSAEQGSSFWSAENSSVASGRGLSDQADRVLRTWSAAALAEAGETPANFAVSAAQGAIEGRADMLDAAFQWSSSAQGDAFWRAEYDRLNAGGALSDPADRILRTWLADSGATP